MERGEGCKLETDTFKRSQIPLLSKIGASTDLMALQKVLLFCIYEITYASTVSYTFFT